MKNVFVTVCALAAGLSSAFENGQVDFNVGAGDTASWPAQPGTGTVVKAGAGGLTLTDPALFGGAVVLQEGSLSLAASGATPAPRPDAVLANAAFHVDASAPASLAAPGGAVAQWADVRGGAYPVATPPDVAPALVPDALNGLPAVDFGRLAYDAGTQRGLHWSARLDGTVREVFWVVGSRHGHGFLLGDSSTYHFHPNIANWDSLSQYATPFSPVFNAGYLPDGLKTGEARLDGQTVPDISAFGLSGAWDIVSLHAADGATALGTASRFASDRNLTAQSGGQALAECIVFETALTPAQREDITAYLRDKWFRGPGLRVLRLDGAGSLSRADGTAPRVNVLTGAGTLSVDGPATLDAVFLAGGTVTLAGTGAAYGIGLLRGTGTLASTLTLEVAEVALVSNAVVTLAAPVTDDLIPEVSGWGALTVPSGVSLDDVVVRTALAVSNNAAPLAVATLAGSGTFDASGCGALAIARLATSHNPLSPASYQTTFVRAGTNTVFIDTLTGDGAVRFEATSGLVTVNDASAFTGELYLENGVTAEILIPPAQPIRQLTVVNAALTWPAPVLAAATLHGRGTFTLNSDLSVSTVRMTANLNITIGGSGPFLFDELTGSGAFTVNRPFYAPRLVLAGNTLTLASNVFDRIAGTGTLVLPSGPVILGEASLSGALTLSNGGGAVTVSNITPTAINSAALVTGGGTLTLGTVTLPDRFTLAVSNGVGAVTVGAFAGTGFFRKHGTGDFHFPVPCTLRNLVVGGGALFPERVSSPALPASVVPAFWLDASLAASVAAGADGRVTEWHDVRGGTHPHAYSTAPANAPFIIPATANGLPVISTGAFWSGRFLRWSEAITVRAFFMACGSHEGMGYFLGNSAKNNWNRSYASGSIPHPNVDGHESRPYVCALWNWNRGEGNTATHLRDGRSYVDGERVAGDAVMPFSGGYEVFSYINDVTDVDADADQFSRYMETSPSYSGGARFGEVLVCTNVVTEAERLAVERYLQAKWIGDLRRLELSGPVMLALAEGETLSVATACGSGSLAQTGPGTLKVSNAALLAGGLDIRAGALAFARTDAAVSYNPAFWVDAAAVQTNQYGYVTNWADTRANGRYAFATNGVNEMEPPALLTAAGPQGRPVIDFNFYGNWTEAPAFRKTSTPHYTWMAFDTAVNIGSAFWLFGSQNGGGFLLAHSSRHDFHRGTAQRGNDLSPALFAGYTDPANGDQRPAHNGYVYADGARVGAQQGGVLNGGYQLIQLVTDGNLMPANRFSRDRASSVQIGGQRLGEVVLFDRVLAEKERLNTEAALSAKWFGDIRAVRFAPGTVFDTGACTSAVTVARLSGSGTVTHTGSAVLRLTEPSAFTGTLATRLDTLDVSLKTPPGGPAPGASLWLDPSADTNAPLADYSGNAVAVTPTAAVPDLLAGELNGLPVLDFGPRKTVADGGKALQFAEGSVPVHSWVAVHGSQEGGGNFLGDDGDYPFYREWSAESGTANPYARLWYDGGGSFAGDALLRGWNMIDGVSENGRAQGFTGGYALYSTVPLERAPWTNVRYIGGDRGNPRGGLRLGETLIYPRRLSDADRVRTEAYLNSKWFARPSYGYAALKTPMLAHVESLGGVLRVPEGRTAVLGRITGAAPAVEGGGGLVLTSGGSAQPAAVTGGDLTLTPTLAVAGSLTVTAGLTFHADASDAASLTPGSGGTVTQWADTRGAGFPYAFADGSTHVNAAAGANAIPGGIPLNPPALAANALNGLPAIDFGPGATNSTVWMKWSQELSPIRSAFFVVRTPFPGNAGGSLLSPAFGDLNPFARRTQSTSYATPRPLFYAAELAARLDGNAINGTKYGLDDAWHLVNVTAPAGSSLAAQAFAADRPGRVPDASVSPNSLRCGGVAYAEVLIYNRVLTPGEVRAVEAYLAAKWFRAGTAAATFGGEAHAAASVALGADGTLILDGVDRSLVTATGPGTVMDAAVPPTVWQLNGPRVFNRGLILAAGAAVYIDYDGNAPAADRVDVTGGLTVQGGGTLRFASVANWLSGVSAFPVFGYDTLTGGGNWPALWRGTGAPNGASVKGALDEAGRSLNANIIPSGFILLLK